jgi:hypothetical protein
MTLKYNDYLDRNGRETVPTSGTARGHGGSASWHHSIARTAFAHPTVPSAPAES